MIAASTYFRVLRDSRGLSRAKLASVLDVSEMTIWRLEEEGQEPKAELLTGLVRTLKARWEDVEALLVNPLATAADGQQRADNLIAMASQMSDQELDEAIALFEGLRSDPKALSRWLGYGERLREERGG